MYILDKNRDYYDFQQGIYGVDKRVTYDRRGSVILSELDLLTFIVPGNTQPTEVMFILEVGITQYLFKVKVTYAQVGEYSWNIQPIRGVFTLLRAFRDHKHYFEKEIAIINMKVGYRSYNWRLGIRDPDYDMISYSDLERIGDQQINNPILDKTSIVGFIPPLEIWKDLDTYISSKNSDKTIEIVNSDVDKLVNHGFDKKQSFRHRK